MLNLFTNGRHWREWVAMSVAAVALLVAFGAQTSRDTVAADEDPPAFVQDETGFDQTVKPFLNQHCLACHGSETAEADFRIDRDLTADFSDRRVGELWREVVDALNGHSMPPESETQPTADEVAVVVDWAVEQAARAETFRRDTQIVLRRLNRDEYRNTVRDLTGVDFDPSALPLDPSAGGFDNNGAALTLSPLHLELFHESAQRIIDAAIVTGEQPESLRWRFEVDSGDSDSNRVNYDGQRAIVNGGNNRVEAGFKILHHNSWDLTLNARDFRLPHAGEYVIRIRAGSKIPTREQVVASAETFLRARRDREIGERPQHERWIKEQYERDLQHFATDPMYDYGPARIKVTRTLGGQPKVVAEFDVAAAFDDPEEYEIRVPFTTESAGITIEYDYAIPKVLENFWLQTGNDFARPEAWVDWMELEGPVYDSWPPASTLTVLSGLTSPPQGAAAQKREAERIVTDFLNRAYRRPVTEAEVASKLRLYQQAREEGLSFLEAIRQPLIAAMVSPNFLYLVEAEAQENLSVAEDSAEQSAALARRPLTPHELACRLSYFLWSTMPDAELRQAADDGSLSEPAELKRQLERMLADPRSEAFVTNFAGQWLQLRDVGANPPAEDLFPHYDRHLETSMVGESLGFFREILRNNLGLSELISSDFVVINERMARYYGIPDVRGDHFRRVEIPAGVERGGVATQASILTITSNGTRTSPVKRGTWILKTLLGTDPGLPVTNVGEIAPKVPGIDKATVRQRLEIHRTLPQCARCHAKIDPLGFALENFDAAGAWRDQEGFGYKGRVDEGDPVIDASSQLPDGTKINGVAGLQAALLERRETFYLSFSDKLTTYALGRQMSLADRVHLNAAVEHLSQPGQDSLRSLIEFIVMSESFRTK